MVENDPHADARKAMRAAVETLRRSRDEARVALAMVDEIVDTQIALDMANDLGKAVRELNEWIYELRRRLVHRIWKTEEPSLAKLAEMADISKGRADQLVREFKREAHAGDEGSSHE